MSSDPPAPPHNPLWHTAKEYLTHWFVAGVIVTLTGFTPDHWVAHVFHAVNLDSLRGVFSEYQFLAVYIGVTFLIVDVVVRNRRQPEPAATAPALADASGFVAASVDAPVLEVIEGKPSIAVLPFVNMSKDPDQEYFADGMTEDIITGLSFDSRLSVTARNSTFAYKGQSPDIRAVGKELGVRYVLEGSIRLAGDRLRITVQLIDTASGNHVWADKIDRPKAELFEVMDEVVDSIVMALCANLGVVEHHRARRQRPEDLQAWALCAQAEFLVIAQPTPETWLEAEGLARRAAELEPGYAASWALLAYLTGYRIVWGMSADLEKDSENILALIGKALVLAPNDPVVLCYCGFAAIWAGQAGQAISYLERSLAINPNNSFSLYAYGAALIFDARPVEGIAQLQLFIRRSPKDPYIGRAWFYLSWCYAQLDEFQQMEQAAQNCVKHLPGFGWAYLALAMALAAQGRIAEIAAPMQKVRQLAPSLTGQAVENFWRHILRTPGHVEKLIALTRQAYGD